MDGRSALRSAARSIRDPCYRSRLTALTVAPTAAAPVINLAFAWQADGRLASTTDFVGNRTPAAATAPLMKASLSTTANQVNGTTTLTGAAQRTLTYKTGGDLVQDVHVAGVTYGYIYNAAKRLTTVSQNGVTSGSYAYDYAGRRVWRRTYGTGAAQTAYIYDEDGHLLAEHNAVTGAATREYVWIGDMPVALADIAGTTTTIGYITTGQIDEPLAVTNAAKALIWNGYVDAFGNASTFTTPTTPLDMRLPGQSFQLETNNLSQNGWRDYDPSLGRYTETDPLGIEAGQNVYAYVDGDPLNWTDWWGLRPDINLLPPGSEEYNNAENIPSTPGLCIIAAHGDASAVRDSQGNDINPSSLGKIINNTPSCVHKPIQLVSCRTGADPGNGQPSFAWSLAHKQGQDVYAPNTLAWPYPNGDVVLANPIPGSNPAAPNPASYGQWVHYSPIH